MADRRMISKSVIDTDMFLDMPISAQCLYFHLLLRADDDGFLKNAKTIMRITGTTEKDMKVLIAKKYVIAFESGIILIRHWKVHNYIKSDRYRPSDCEEKEFVKLDGNNVYVLSDEGKKSGCIQTGTEVEPNWNQNGTSLDPKRIQTGTEVEPQVRLELGKSKDSIRESIERKRNLGSKTRFKKPTIDEIKEYIHEKGYTFSAERFFNYYESNGWMVGRNHMKSWKAACVNWETRQHSRRNTVGSSNNTSKEVNDIPF